MMPASYRGEVLVTLTAVDPSPSFEFPFRRILLTKAKPTVAIGRTSKRNPDLEAAETNAWIDSAVMSRNHAEITMDAETQKVLIKDIGSLHGTFHNNTRLSHNQTCVLEDGDVIQLGVPVDRGLSTFPPCMMRIGFGFGSWPAEERPAVFRVPDESDVEEMGSDDDVGVQHSSQILRDNKIRPAPHQPAFDSNVSVVEKVNPAETSQPRIPTPPRTIEISDDEPVFYDEDSFLDDDDEGEDYGTDIELDSSPSVQGEQPVSAPSSIRQRATASPRYFHVDMMDESNEEPQSSHEVENTQRFFENACLPPILSRSKTELPDADASRHIRLPSIAATMSMSSHVPSSRSAAEIMGAKTGKMDFFLSREHNKLQAQMIAPVPTEDNLVSLSSGAAFLNSPLKDFCEPVGAFSSPDLDETSAYMFELSKKTMAQQLAAKGSQMSVHGPVLSNSESPGSRPNKRKAADISQMTPEEEFTESNEAPAAPNAGPSSPTLSTESKPGEPATTPNASPVAVRNLLSRECNDARPTKRLRKAAEIFGYAALGGVAVMSALIATAPAL